MVASVRFEITGLEEREQKQYRVTEFYGRAEKSPQDRAFADGLQAAAIPCDRYRYRLERRDVANGGWTTFRGDVTVDEERQVVIVGPPAARVEGGQEVIFDEEKPKMPPGLDVQLLSLGDAKVWARLVNPRTLSSTNADPGPDGKLSFRHVPAGNFVLILMAQGRATQAAVLNVSSDNPRRGFSLRYDPTQSAPAILGLGR